MKHLSVKYLYLELYGLSFALFTSPLTSLSRVRIYCCSVPIPCPSIVWNLATPLVAQRTLHGSILIS